jgi:sorbitol-specific phosphotransferase system component IIC
MCDCVGGIDEAVAREVDLVALIVLIVLLVLEVANVNKVGGGRVRELRQGCGGRLLVSALRRVNPTVVAYLINCRRSSTHNARSLREARAVAYNDLP